MQDIFEAIIEARKVGIPSALATVTAVKGSSPGKEHFKMLVREDGRIIGSVGGGALESEVIEKAKEIMRSEKAEEFSFNLIEKGPNASGMLCGGTISVFIEPIVNCFAYIFGGGHIGLYLNQVLSMIGFSTIIIDDREEFSNKERFPGATETIAGEYLNIMPKLEIKKPSYIIITTRGHKFDEEVLEWAIKQDAKYVGMIGSKGKVATIFNRLKDKGITQQELDKVYSPIGLKIGAMSAEEIAVAIAAEIIQVKRQK
ncbi:MAG: XdhC/CoxI family protein [Cyanobacteriota bacterium]